MCVRPVPERLQTIAEFSPRHPEERRFEIAAFGRIGINVVFVLRFGCIGVSADFQRLCSPDESPDFADRRPLEDVVPGSHAKTTLIHRFFEAFP